ncbi:drebrin isoform X4 [Pyxicephalus adspersus]|uniref:Drebrin n=1 Tax=Pyxicephalus adspersus TaxID=30357 RepID=A0AAV3B1F9_PYXAD|nr:TPA: hypothetical protein GDO54_006831 [Pyxicephalus adspersus]
MASVSFKAHRLELLAAYQDVIQEQNSIDWALYTYEDGTDNLMLATSGGGGLHDLSSHFENQKVMYGFCSVKEPHAMLARYVLINWVGEDVADARKCACASHVAHVAEFFQGVDVIVNASSVEDIDPMAISQRLSNGSGRLASPVLQRLQLREDSDSVGTNYQKTNAAVEMKRLNREQFWEQAKKEEEERKQEERQKALEERLRFEQERMEQERKEQEEREKRYQEREQQIEEHRKKLQDEEAEEAKRRLQSNSIFMDQRDEDEAAEQKRTESEVEEAAAIIAQRTENPREFFKQQERASSDVNVSLLPPRTAVRSSSEAGPPRTPEKERRSSLGEDWNKSISSDQPVQDGAWAQQGLTEDVFMEVRDEDAGFPDAPQLTGCEDEAVIEMGEANLMSDVHPEPPKEASDLLDLWQNSEAQETTWTDGNLVTSHEDIQTEQKPSETEACPAVPEENLLNFEELPQPPPTFCDMETEEDPQSIIHIEGPHQMTLSYQHALQEASCHQPELTDSLLTNGETSQREGAQASEGYFSQSQDEDFAQTDDVSAKATPPVFYNKPPEIDITCWDSDPVMEEDDEEGGGFGESA